MAKKKAVIICPGRGTYNAAELGYLSRHHSDKQAFLDMIDRVRAEADQSSITALDSAEPFRASKHGRGDNASLLIYACALADYFSINRDLYDVVGVTGNSMGWYLSLAVAGALSLEDGARLVNGMGNIMTEHGVGGQVVYRTVDDEWRPNAAKQKSVDNALSMVGGVSIDTSIRLGGMHVFAGGERGLKHLLSTLPKDDIYPFQLRGHSAFHSAKLDHIVPVAKAAFKADMFSAPKIPMIDGQGSFWRPYAACPKALFDYTLGAQINSTYDFTKAVTNAAKELAPDVFIVLGPGGTMGAPVAQSLIATNWEGLTSKSDFLNRQKMSPFILSMGRDDGRALVVKNNT